VTRRRDVIRRISARAAEVGVEWVLDREGSNHSVYRLGGLMIPIPRHSEIGERTTQDIYRECAEVLGKGWWRR
jgi:hypothetical protein